MATIVYKPENILYDSLYPVASTILDLAKLQLYYYHNDVSNTAFLPDKVSLIITDTDSLIFSVNCENFFKNIKSYHFLISVILKQTNIYILIKTEKLNFFQT